MRNVLFLPDADTKLEEDERFILESVFDNVIALEPKYYAEEVFREVELIARQFEVTHIVGVGIGGHIARHLSDLLQVPAMLVAPEIDTPFCERQPLKEVHKPYKKKLVVVGHLDKVLNKGVVYKYARSRNHEVLLVQAGDHVLSPVDFDDAITRFEELYFPAPVAKTASKGW